jgi:hypothetical protein
MSIVARMAAFVACQSGDGVLAVVEIDVVDVCIASRH